MEVDVDDLEPDVVLHALAGRIGPGDAGIGHQDIDAAVARIGVARRLRHARANR